MKRILIFGLKDPAGGVEHAVTSYVRCFSPEALTADFLVFGEKFSLEPEIVSRGGRVFYLPDRIRNRKAYLKALDGVFAETDYDAVWCHFSGLTNIDPLTFAKKHGVPKRVAHAHTAAYAWSGALMRFLVPLFHTLNKRKICSVATNLWACAKGSAAFMYPKGAEVKLVPNAVETERFTFSEADRMDARAEWGLGNAPVLGHVGRMCVAKNQRFLLEIFKEVLQKEPAARLLFVGDGELHDEVFAAAEALGVKDKVVFTGARNDVPRLLNAMDAFLLPSVTEGFPVTMVEAQVNGLPCVASAEAVAKETDLGGRVRFLSLNESPDVWADASLEAMAEGRDPDGPGKAAAAGFDIKTAAAAVEAFFCG